ncbi:hypothetical protein D7294_17540 [Streptomyces hoynatensis]|uniref:Integral membrane protein n=1 Tax=Streptomyces hoynatensis TaxID=1141874 RepID=A0A3A9YYY8_9ACTN|nr:hypothetical protein D7294_17540 [Streptomyces hoynatensis]
MPKTSWTAHLTRARAAFRAFRWRRPFWAGLFVMIAGLPILYFPYANLTLGQLTIRMATTGGAGSLVIGILLIVLGLATWFQPHVRIFAGVAAIMLSLVSLVVSNFGGFLIGFFFGLVGGGMSIAWVPGQAAPAPAQDAGARPVPEPSPGTGSALASFGSGAPEPEKDTGKVNERAE